MKKLLSALALILTPVVAHSQEFDPNLIFTAGASYMLTAPSAGGRVQLAVTSSMPGMKITDNLFGGSLYTLSPGFTVHMVSVANGSTTGLAVALGGITYHPGGGQFVVQVGATRDITGDERSTSIFLALGGSLTSPKTIQAKREAKVLAKARAKKAAMGPPADSLHGLGLALEGGK